MAAALDARGAQVSPPVQQTPAGRWLLAGLPLVFLGVVLVAPVLRLLAEGLGLAGDPLLTGEPASWWLPWQDAHLRWRLGWSLTQAAVTCCWACRWPGCWRGWSLPGVRSRCAC